MDCHQTGGIRLWTKPNTKCLCKLAQSVQTHLGASEALPRFQLPQTTADVPAGSLQHVGSSSEYRTSKHKPQEVEMILCCLPISKVGNVTSAAAKMKNVLAWSQSPWSQQRARRPPRSSSSAQRCSCLWGVPSVQQAAAANLNAFEQRHRERLLETTVEKKGDMSCRITDRHHVLRNRSLLLTLGRIYSYRCLFFKWAL